MRTNPFLLLLVCLSSAFANFSGSDSFDTATANWSAPVSNRSAQLAVTGGRLEYTTLGAGTDNDAMSRFWDGNYGSYTADWSVRIDVMLDSFPMTTTSGFSYLGIYLINDSSPYDDFIRVAISRDASTGRWFYSDGCAHGTYLGARSVETTSKSAALQVSYDSSTHILTAGYDDNGAIGGYAFTPILSWDIDSASSNWGMTPSDRFRINFFGQSGGTQITSGQAYFDNFLAVSGSTQADVTTEAFTNVTMTSVTLHGTVDPNGAIRTASFEWGTSPTLATSIITSAGSTTAGMTPEAITATLGGLTPNTTYYYRARGEYAESVTPQTGQILSFTTPSNSPPSVTLTGSDPLTFEAAASYTDAGATANDFDDGALAPVITSNTVKANVPGNYTVTWTATDSFGATGSAIREVTVQDTTAPIVGGTFSPLKVQPGTPLPDYTAQASVTDIAGVTSVTQSPAPGTATSAGTVEVTITAKDAANNTRSVMFTVTVNAPPAVTLTGSDPLTFEAAASYTDAGATANDPDDGALVPVITSNTVMANVPGNYTVMWTATDSLGATGSATREVTVQDTTAPTINGTFSPLSVAAGSPLPDYTAQAGATDIVGVTSVKQSPAPGTATISGTVEVKITAKDAAKNVARVSFTITVTPDHPVAAAHATTGGAVPNAGGDPRIQAGALWTALGTPAINDAGAIAFRGEWTAPAISGPIPVPAQLGRGIFIDETLVITAGEAVPNAGTGSLPADAVFNSFRDPVIDAGGHVAFLAVMAGTGVGSNNDTVVMSNGRAGNLEVLAREGDVAPGTGGAKFKGFSNVSVQGTQVGGTIFTGSLIAGSGNPKVTGAKDSGTWWLPAGESAVLKLVREGDAGFEANEFIRSFSVLSALSGSPGHGRGQASGESALIWLSLGGGGPPRYAQVLAQPGTLTLVAATGDLLGSDTLVASWRSMSLPSSGSQGRSIAVLGSLSPDGGLVTSANEMGIFESVDSGTNWESVARTGDPAPGLGDGATFSRFFDPVHSSTDAGLAFLGSARGGAATGADKAALWWKPEGGTLTLVAKEGSQPPASPEGARWKSFTSVALPGNGSGPIFTASLHRGAKHGGITSSDDVALYAVDSFGIIHELIRENQPLAGKVVKRFSVLKATSGTAGVTRSFNANHEVVADATFIDDTTGIVKIRVP